MALQCSPVYIQPKCQFFFVPNPDAMLPFQRLTAASTGVPSSCYYRSNPSIPETYSCEYGSPKFLLLPLQSFHSRDLQLRVRESQVLRVLRLRGSSQLRSDAHGRRAARSRQVSHAGRPRQVREHNQRVPRDGPGGRHAGARQGMGADVLRVLDAGRREVRLLRGLQDDVRKHAGRGG